MECVEVKFRKKSEIIMCTKLIIEENKDKNILVNKYVKSKLEKYCTSNTLLCSKSGINKDKNTIRIIVIDKVVNYKFLCEMLEKIRNDRIYTYIVTKEKNRSGLDRTLKGVDL